MASRLFAFIALSAGLFTTTATDATAFAQPRDAPSKLGLKDVNHVVLYMQENRAFDHMLGTLAGVSGYRDPNVQVNPQDAVNGLKNVYYQNVSPVLSNATNFLLPFQCSYLGGTWVNATQCMSAGSNGFTANHAAVNNDQNNMWPLANTPWSWCYFTRDDIPFHYGLADAFGVADRYQESVIASTNPNRIAWGAGTINVPGGNTLPSQGGPFLDNNETPGCELVKFGSVAFNISCYPASYKTMPEYLEELNVTWKVYQSSDNFDDNEFAWFQQYQEAAAQDPITSPLALKGLADNGPNTQTSWIDAFKADAAAGTLPAVSILVGPAELSEHPQNRPNDGAWQTQQIINALIMSPSWETSVLILSYDENGGFGDHHTPYHSPEGTPGEWIVNPFTGNSTYVGPGVRVPCYIVSPFSRGTVFTEPADHTSQIKFVEKWLQAKGKGFVSKELIPWRRLHMSDMTAALDFSNPDYSVPTLPVMPHPQVNSVTGLFDGSETCQKQFPVQRPPVPYGMQDEATALFVEPGFRRTVGMLTEGRYLVFQQTSSSGQDLGLTVTNTTSCSPTLTANLISSPVPLQKELNPSQRFIIHTSGFYPDFEYQIQSAFVNSTDSFFGSGLAFVEQTDAATFLIVDHMNGQGYSIQEKSSKKFVSIDSRGRVLLASSDYRFTVFAVTFAL